MLPDPVWSRPDPCIGCYSRRDLTCVTGCSGPGRARSAAPTAAGGCWSRGRGPWRWWPSGWSPAPARTRWNSGWRKYCALPAMRNKEINKKAKAPLMRRSAQLDYNRLSSHVHLLRPASRSWTGHKRALRAAASHPSSGLTLSTNACVSCLVVEYNSGFYSTVTGCVCKLELSETPVILLNINQWTNLNPELNLGVCFCGCVSQSLLWGHSDVCFSKSRPVLPRL